MHALGRGLRQADTVTFITTPDEFIAALGRGDPHLQVTEHLDFEGYSAKAVGNDWDSSATLIVGPSVRSIRVRLCVTLSVS